MFAPTPFDSGPAVDIQVEPQAGAPAPWYMGGGIVASSAANVVLTYEPAGPDEDVQDVFAAKMQAKTLDVLD